MTGAVMRVLVLADSRAFHTERYVRELRRQGCRVLTASLEHGTMSHFHLSPEGPLKGLNYALASCQLPTIARRFRPHIVNPHFVSGYGFMATLARLQKQAPVVMTMWGSDILVVPNKSLFHKWKVTRALRYADFVFGDSKYILDKARALVSLKEFAVVPWGIEEKYLELHHDRPINGPLRIIVPRTHEEVYGNEEILRALAPLIVLGQVLLTVPAFGTQVERFRALGNRLVGERIQYYQKMPRSCFLKFMANHDCYLSNARSDSSPASLIEAFALGLVPIAADIPGVREWFTAESGYRFTPGNAAELRAILEKILSDRGALSALRARNLAKVRREALFEQNIATVIEVMRRLAARRAG